MYANVSNLQTQIAAAQAIGSRAYPFPRQSLAALIPSESFDPAALRAAMQTRQAVLRPGVDHQGRTIVLGYLPGKAQAPEVFFASLLHFGDTLRRTARQRGMSNLAARLCVALVENGNLRRASEVCGVTVHTARSEIADAMRIAGATSQGGLICRLADGWLCAPLDSDRAVSLLMSAFGLRPREARVASLRAAGYNKPEIEGMLGLSRWAIQASCSTVFSALGVTKAPELTRVVADLVLTAGMADSYAAPAPMRA